jgi:hypothetical protein
MRAAAGAWGGAHDTLGWVARQGTVAGLDAVFFNFPQHLHGLDVDDVEAALAAANLTAGAVCMRFPAETFRLGG